MTNYQLKAELAQLAGENQRLLGVLRQVKLWWDTEEAQRYFVPPVTSKIVSNTLQTPPTPGIGAAMLRVVEAAILYDENPTNSALQLNVRYCVQALNQLEAKHE